MPLFTYSAAKQDGSTTTGQREAENPHVLAQLLRQDGLFLLQAAKEGEKKQMTLITGGKSSASSFLDRFKPIKLVDKMFFTRNLGVMVQAGLSLSKALDALAKQTTNPRLQFIIQDVNHSVIQGQSFAEALGAHEKVFDTLFVHMIEVGETTGKLTDILKLLAQQMKKDYDLRKRVKGALIYPGVIISALFIVGVFMMIYVIPTLTSTIKGLGVPLPLTTRVIIGASDFFAHYYILVIALIIGFVVLVLQLFKTNAGRRLFDRLILKAPIFGSITEKFNTARFCRTLYYLTTAGVPIVHSLEITSSVIGNSLFKIATKEASEKIQKGESLHEILQEYPKIFQPMILQMIEVGEETGELSHMLLRLALFFEDEVNNVTKNLSSIIEPILMLFIGASVGFFAVAMIQPIYSSIGAM